MPSVAVVAGLNQAPGPYASSAGRLSGRETFARGAERLDGGFDQAHDTRSA